MEKFIGWNLGSEATKELRSKAVSRLERPTGPDVPQA